MDSQTDKPELTEAQKAVAATLARRAIPVVVRWVASDHASPLARAACKALRWGLGLAGASGVANGVLTDAQTARAVDWLLVALPLVLELASHYRSDLAAWIAARHAEEGKS